MDILEEIKSSQYGHHMFYFLSPIREAFDEAGWDEYKSEIENPRDLTIIETTLQNDGYSSLSAFCKDVDLCFDNAKKYNRNRHKHVAEAASAMQKVILP